MSTTEIPQEIKDKIIEGVKHDHSVMDLTSAAIFGYSLSQQERDELRKEVERLKGLIADLNIQIHQLLQ